MDLTTLGGVFATLGAIATGAWAWWLKNQKNVAHTRAEVAESDRDKAIADSEHTLYKLLNQRVESLEVEIRELRAELSIERKHSRALELHIYRLEGLMRRAGIEPPEREYAA